MKSNIRSAQNPMKSRCICMCFTYCFLSVILLSACSTNKKIAYFQNVPDSIYRTPSRIAAAAFSDPLIQPNDILQISILTLDPSANTILTSANTSSFSVQPGTSQIPGMPQPVNGFLVDKDGFIEIPVVGKIKLGGMSTSIARDTIHNAVSRFYKDPVVNVRFTNFSITILGEVARPAAYVVPSEKLSVIDAIGMAGDLTIYGKRENILLVRDSVGQKQFIRFNLNSSDIFLSPYFYMKQGDVVYVEPNRAKVASTDVRGGRNIALVASGISVLIAIITRL